MEVGVGLGGRRGPSRGARSPRPGASRRLGGRGGRRWPVGFVYVCCIVFEFWGGWGVRGVGGNERDGRFGRSNTHTQILIKT